MARRGTSPARWRAPAGAVGAPVGACERAGEDRLAGVRAVWGAAVGRGGERGAGRDLAPPRRAGEGRSRQRLGDSFGWLRAASGSGAAGLRGVRTLDRGSPEAARLG